MNTTKERLDQLKIQEQVMDYAKELKYAIYFDLVEEVQSKEELKAIDNEFDVFITYQTYRYSPHLNASGDIVFATKKSDMTKTEEPSLSKTMYLKFTDDYKDNIERLKRQDQVLQDKYKTLLAKKEETQNPTRTFVLVTAWITLGISLILSLVLMTYGFVVGIFGFLGSLGFTAILFALAEILKLLEAKQKS